MFLKGIEQRSCSGRSILLASERDRPYTSRFYLNLCFLPSAYLLGIYLFSLLGQGLLDALRKQLTLTNDRVFVLHI